MLLGVQLLPGETPAIPPNLLWVWLTAAVSYAVAFWLSAAAVGNERLLNRARMLVAVQSIAALVMFYVVCSGYETTQLVVVAAQMGLFFPLPLSIGLVMLQSAIQGWLALDHFSPTLALWWVGALTLPYSSLALLTSHLAASQARGRRALAGANAELRATQALLADSSRMSERIRISHELHDLLGHHLTGLSLNLEAARHQVQGKPLDAISRSQALTKLLLSDVREAVSSLREDTLDLATALARLVEGIPHPNVHLNLPEHLTITDPERAHALVRCVQEIVTNTLKHARADNLWIELVTNDEELHVRAHDDGKATTDWTLGHGLRGMRERLEHLGGRLEIEARPYQGFHLDAWIPLTRAAS
jgi:signal transduction histidine kinase